jgi:hypothetical protein
MAATALDAQLFQNISTQTAGFRLKGGEYGVGVQASFGGQTVAFQVLGPDGSNCLSICTATAATFQIINILPANSGSP